jgi:hypothetical protein
MSEYLDLDTSTLMNDGRLFNAFDRLSQVCTVTFIMTVRTFSVVYG